MKLAPHDTWPDLRIVLRPLPWTWHLRPVFYVDDKGAAGHWSFQWLFLTVEWWAQDTPSEWFVDREPDPRELFGSGSYGGPTLIRFE